MFHSLRMSAAVGRSAAVVFCFLGTAAALAEPGLNRSSRPADVGSSPAASLGLFEAVAQQKLVVQVVPHDQSVVRLTLANRSGEPLQIEMPPALGAVPVPPILAQQGLRGIQPNNPQTPGATSADNKSPQPLGLWQNATANGPNNGRPGNPAGPNRPAFFNFNFIPGQEPTLVNVALATSARAGAWTVLPGKPLALVFHGVCLAFGRPTPTPRMAYQIRPLEQTSSSADVRRLLTIVGTEDIPQRVAQPAAWHLANGLSWEKMTDHSSLAGIQPQHLRFSVAEIQAAKQLVERATRNPSPSASSGHSSSGT